MQSSLTKKTSTRQTPSATAFQSAMMKTATAGGPGKSFESPRSHDSSKIFEFSSQNIISKAGSKKVENSSVHTNVPRSINNLTRVVKNEKTIQTSRPEQSKNFSKNDFQKLNLMVPSRVQAKEKANKATA